MKPVLSSSIQINLPLRRPFLWLQTTLSTSHTDTFHRSPLLRQLRYQKPIPNTGTRVHKYSAKTHLNSSALRDMNDSIQPHNHLQSRLTTVQDAVPQATPPSMTTPNDPPAAQTHSPGVCALVPSDAPTFGRVKYPCYRLRWNIVSFVVSCFLWEKVLHQYFCLGIIEKAHSQRTGQVRPYYTVRC